MVYEDGTVIGIRDKIINKAKKNIIIKAKIDNEFINIPIMRFIYYAFNQKTFDIKNYDIMITQKIKSDDIGIANLEAIKRNKYIQGENNCNAKLTDKQIEEIVLKYKKNQNQDQLKNTPNKTVSYRTLAEEYGVSHSLISGIITRRFRNKDNYKLK